MDDCHLNNMTKLKIYINLKWVDGGFHQVVTNHVQKKSCTCNVHSHHFSFLCYFDVKCFLHNDQNIFQVLKRFKGKIVTLRVMVSWYSPCLGPRTSKKVWVQTHWCLGESLTNLLLVSLNRGANVLVGSINVTLQIYIYTLIMDHLHNLVSLRLWCSIYKSGKIGYMIFQWLFSFCYIWQSLGHVIVFQIIFLLMNFMDCPWIYLVRSSLLTKLYEHYLNAYENFLCWKFLVAYENL